MSLGFITVTLLSIAENGKLLLVSGSGHICIYILLKMFSHSVKNKNVRSEFDIYTHTQQDKWGVGCILFGAYKSCTEVKQKRNRILIETQIDKRCHFNIIILVIIM